MFTPWATVETHPATTPITLRTSDGSIAHDEFVNTHIPEARTGHWYYNKYFFAAGHLHTMLSSGDYEREYPVWYGRRLMRWSDNSQVSVDYALQVSRIKPQRWDEDVEYKPTADTPPLPKRTRYLSRDEIVPLDDPESTQPLLLTLHGLTGGSHESYVRAVICKMAEVAPEFECIVMNSRGCNRTKISTPQLFNAAWTEDVRQLVKHITTKQPYRPIYLVGYSLGASVLVNYVGQEGENMPHQIRAAAPVSAPWDLMMCHLLLASSWIGRNIYDKQMADNLNRLVRNNRAELLESPEFCKREGAVKRSTCIFEFDENMTAPSFGFTGSWDYYRSAACVQRLGNVRTPMLILSARDDPICGDNATPFDDVRANPYVHLVTTTSGGHLGWFQAGTKERWYATVLAKYFSSMNAHLGTKATVEEPQSDWKRRWFRDGKFQMGEPLHEVE